MEQVGEPSASAVADEVAATGGFGSLGSVIFFLVAAWAAFVALLPLNDNSFFTHLATGRLILEQGAVPATDPYSYTAAGTSWTVQSWLPSLAYAAAERLGGTTAIRLLVLSLFLFAAALCWMLTRQAQAIVPRLLIIAIGMVVASGTWSERPYMVGVIGMALVWLALDDRLKPWLLFPYGWLWANSHGSFPLAVGLCGAVIVGTWMDQRAVSYRPVRDESGVLAYLLAGLVGGAFSPLGVRALTFPVRALSRSNTFGLIREWQAPDFTSASERAFLLLLVLALAAVVRSGKWRHVLPLVALSVAALLAKRNIPMALPVFLAIAAAGAPSIGSLRSATRPALGALVAALMATLVLSVAAAGLQSAPLALDDYPTRALAFTEHWNERVLAQDFSGNLLEVLDGVDASVFIDDRVDMFPSSVLDSYLELHRAQVGWSDVLDEYRIGLVVWERSHPLSAVLAADPRWRIAFADSQWLVAHRRK